MTQVATVEKLMNTDMAEIAVSRQSACAHDCAECAGCGIGCGAEAAVIHAQARNLIGAQPGDQVVVESSTRKMLGIAGIVYLVPMILFLAGYGIGAYSMPGNFRYLLAVAGFIVGILFALRYDRKIRRKGGISFTIIRFI
jgi:sigma-E factor negative regulatory protein RseC